MTAWPFIAGGCILALAAMVAIVTAFDKRPDPGPLFNTAYAAQLNHAAQVKAAGPLAPFPDLTRMATPAERHEAGVGEPLYSWQTGEFAAILEDGETP